MPSKRAGLHKVMRRHFLASLGERDGHGWTCFYCRQPLREYGDNNHPDSPAIEHRVPLARGGTDEMRNLRLACAACNQAKGTQTDDEFLRKSAVPTPIPVKSSTSDLEMELHIEQQLEINRLFKQITDIIYPSVTGIEPIDNQTATERKNRLSKANW